MTTTMCDNPDCDSVVELFMYMGNDGPVYRKASPDDLYCRGCTALRKFKEELENSKEG